MAARWCRDSDAQDVAQEVLLRLIRQQQEPRKAEVWIYVVTRRVCHRMRLSMARREQAEESFHEVERSSPLPADLAIETKKILDRLSARDQLVLALVLHGVPAGEIASRFGCKTRDVGQIVKRARQKARRLRDSGDPEGRHKTSME